MRTSVFVHAQSLPADEDKSELRRAIEDARVGGHGGFDYLYGRYADNVFSYVRTIVRDDHAAEDVTQQVFAKLLVKIDRYEQRAVPFTAWLLRIARNAAIDHVRADRQIPVEEVLAAEAPFDDTARERREELTQALHELSEDQRRVLVLRHFIGMSPREIAAEIGKSEGAVHTLHHRGRNRLKAELTRRGTSPSALAIA